MNEALKTVLAAAGIAALILGAGLLQGWNTALLILNMGLVSAIMAIGVNLQWGFAGLFNVGVMGFVALGGLAVVVLSMPPTAAAWAAGGAQMMAALAVGVATLAGGVMIWTRMAPGRWRVPALIAALTTGFLVYRALLVPAAARIEAIDPALTGYLGGFGLPVILSWPAGALLAAGVAWLVGKTALGLRSDYLAIATLGIAEIIIAVLRNEEWLARGVKNVVGLPRPVPYEVDLQQDPDFVARASDWGLDPVLASTLFVKIEYALLFTAALVIILVLAELALKSPWGRMMRAIRDNEVAAEAMGKDVKRRHLQVFVLGSALCGLAGAMMTTLDGQLTPSAYQPLRFSFMVWVMVIVGGSGNNYGAVLGGFLIWFLWVEMEPIGRWILDTATLPLSADSALRDHLIDSAAYMRPLTLGLVLLVVLRFRPRGLLPER